MILVQPTNRFHVFWRQLKIKDSDILVSVVLIVATRYCNEASLHVPTQDDLGYRSNRQLLSKR